MYELQVRVKTGKGIEWRSVRPVREKPYQYKTIEGAKAARMLCNDGSLGRDDFQVIDADTGEIVA